MRGGLAKRAGVTSTCSGGVAGELGPGEEGGSVEITMVVAISVNSLIVWIRCSSLYHTGITKRCGKCGDCKFYLTNPAKAKADEGRWEAMIL